MQIEILTQQDDNFRIIGLANPSKTEELVKQLEEAAIVEIPVEEVPVEVVYTPQSKPAPIENQRGLDWFNGTSWGNQ